MTRALAIVLCFFTTVAAHSEPDPHAPNNPNTSHRIMSFNIRLGSANDGPDRWEVRRDKVFDTIRDLNADVVGLQEAEPFQVRELLAALPRYAAAGVHRDDGLLQGEAATILYDRARYTLAATDTFWLSGTPDVAGSNTWGAACNRTCTWVRLLDLETGEAFFVFNTHFDHQSQPAREKSATLIVEQIAARTPTDPFVVTGDLNAAEDTAVVRTLKNGADDWQLTDTYRAHHPHNPHNPDSPAGTFTGFDLDNDGGDRKIDYVLTGPGWTVDNADIDRRKIDGRYPSDHFPIWADLTIEP